MMLRICAASTVLTKTATVGYAGIPNYTGNDLAVAAADAVAALEMILGAYEAEITGGRVAFPMQRRAHPLVAWREGR